MNLKSVITLFSACGFLISCEHSYDYSYVVNNSTDTTISIHIKTSRIDSVFKLLTEESKIVYFTDHGVEGSKGPYFQDVKEDLDAFTVTKGQLVSKRDYGNNNAWRFDQGVYKTTINKSDF